MAKITSGLATAFLAMGVVCATAGPAFAQASAAQILSIKPKCDDVAYTTPAADELGACKLDVVKGAGGASGYLLVDGGKRPLRKFVDSDGDGRVDTWSFFKDGQEVYREQVTKAGYNFRWIGAGGMKWGVGGVDQAGKGRIASWKMIAADEAAQEAFLAMASGDFERMKALFITEQEVIALGLSAQENARLHGLQKGAAEKFQKERAKRAGLAQATFTRLEGGQPGAFPTDVTGAGQDLVKITRGLILFENPNGQKKHDWMPAPEMILVGQAWRLTDVPSETESAPVNDALRLVLNQLAEHDKNQVPGPKDKVALWNLQRVQIVAKVAEEAKAEERESWYKQVFDNLAAAVVAGDETNAPAMLAQWKNRFAQALPGSNLAAYGAYREIWANFQLKMAKSAPKEMPKIQEEYHVELNKFVKAFPKADDAPDALIQLAMGAEFSGKKEAKDEAKNYYQMIVANFPNNHNAAKAAGAVRRLDSVGNKLALTGPQLGSAQTFDAASLKGKVVVVYYWASYSGQSVGDFANLKKLQETFAKDLAIVTVSLDEQAAEPTQFIQRQALPGAVHLHQAAVNGTSPLAAQYGIFGLPHLFLVDRDGKVVNNQAQIGGLEDEISKLVK